MVDRSLRRILRSLSHFAAAGLSLCRRAVLLNLFQTLYKAHLHYMSDCLYFAILAKKRVSHVPSME